MVAKSAITNQRIVKIALLITWAAIVLVALFWLATIVGWLMTELGFEPINVLVYAILTSLTAVFGRLRTLKKKSVVFIFPDDFVEKVL